MRVLLFVALFLIPVLQTMGQAADASNPALPKDPRAVFAAAASLYDFSDPALKPWHLKASYQLYDDAGKPSEQGTYEYWWASPTVHRSSWTRPSASRTDWYTADGKHSYKAAGDDLSYFEYKLQEMLLSPLPSASWLDPAKHDLLDQSLTTNGSRIPCYEIVPAGTKPEAEESLPGTNYRKYCFSPRIPMVIGIYSLKASFTKETVLANLGDFVQMQGKFLPRNVAFRFGKLLLITATVETVEMQETLNPSDARFVAPADGILVTTETLAGFGEGKLVPGKLIKHPGHGASWGRQGKFSAQVQLVIGTDGHVRQIRNITATSPEFAKFTRKEVAEFVYSPFTLDGEAVQVEIEAEMTIVSNR